MSVTARHFDLYKSHRLNMLKRPNPKNPFVGARPAFTPQQSPVFCTKEDVQKLMATVSEQWLKDSIVFAVLTGMRRGEIVNLRRKDVNMDNRTLKIESNPSLLSKEDRNNRIGYRE
jgi:integrase